MADFDFLGSPKPIRPKRQQKSQPAFNSPLTPEQRQKTARATGVKDSRRAGQYKQLTFRLPDEVVEEIRYIARAEGLSIEETKRWIVYMGLGLYEQGERPVLDEEVVRRQVDASAYWSGGQS